MTKLSVNVNKVATLRNTRSVGMPSPVRAAESALLAGAAGITVHPRPDKRHIVKEDVDGIALLMEHWHKAEFNIEGNPLHGLFNHVHRVGPDQATLVPDEPTAPTSDHGWDFQEYGLWLQEIVAELHELGTRVSLFVDPIPELMPVAAKTGADCVELYTEPFALSYKKQDLREEGVRFYRETAEAAAAEGLRVNAGHDLNRQNLGFFLDHVPNVAEVSIGHALIADAIELGLAETVRRYIQIIEDCQRQEAAPPYRRPPK